MCCFFASLFWKKFTNNVQENTCNSPAESARGHRQTTCIPHSVVVVVVVLAVKLTCFCRKTTYIALTREFDPNTCDTQAYSGFWPKLTTL